jgi:hypothetical protein
MQNKLWYNNGVPVNFEKKDQPLALRISTSLLRDLEKICEIEDRKLGYVARELMVRGLAQYRADGRLREDSQPKAGHLAPVVATIGGGEKEQVRRDYERGTQTVPVLKKKAK